MKVLLANTRELCYFSGSYFLNRIQEELTRAGVEVVRLDLSEDEADFSLLQEQIGKHFDAILDINSRLPYLIDEKGGRILNQMDAPFFNYIVDHPLYHHPGLVFPIHRYYALGVDRMHCTYMKQYYPQFKDVQFLPLGGTKALTDIPFRARRKEILFMGTYIQDDDFEHRILGLRQQLNNATYQLALDLYDAWDDERETIEECLHSLLMRYGSCKDEEQLTEYINDAYEMRDFPELLNAMFLVDQRRRNENRIFILTRLAETHAKLMIVGEGWKSTPLADYENVTIRGGCSMEQSFEQMVQHRFLLDINPAFRLGMHDRVASGLANGCVAVTNMSPKFDEELKNQRQLLYYKKQSAAQIPEWLSDLTEDEMEEISDAAKKQWQEKYSFPVRVKEWIRMIDNIS